MRVSADSPRDYQDYWFRSVCRPADPSVADFSFDVAAGSRPQTDLQLAILSFLFLLLFSLLPTFHPE